MAGRIVSYLRQSDIDWAENREEFYRNRTEKFRNPSDQGILWNIGFILDKLLPFNPVDVDKEVIRSVKLEAVWRREREILEQIQFLADEYDRVEEIRQELDKGRDPEEVDIDNLDDLGVI